MAEGHFVGVGVGTYAQGHEELACAVPDVDGFRGLLGSDFDGEPKRNPTKSEISGHLDSLPGSLEGVTSLVLLWSGHAVPSPAGGLRLLAADSASGLSAGFAPFDVIGPCAESGASQLLFIIDACFAGQAVGSATEVGAAFLQAKPPDAQHVWVGVVASCSPLETARDGLFGQRLRALLTDGPGDPARRVMWSKRTEFISGEQLGSALLAEWDGGQSPQFRRDGVAVGMFRNPLYDPGAPEQVVEHLLLAARGGAGTDERSWFTGRRVEVDQVVAWVRSGLAGVHVVTGSAGTGKSAIAGRVVSLSDPAERERLLAEGRPLGHEDPGERSVGAHVHARGLTADRVADLLGGQLVRARVLVAQDEKRNAAELVGQVQRAVQEGAAPPVIVVDGLDEARAEAFGIAEDLLVPLARHVVVIVATRQMRRGDAEPPLVDTLAPDGAGLDLDDPAVRERGRADLREYVTRRLDGVDARMDAGLVAGYLAGETSTAGSRPFLLARLVTDQLRAVPVDTSLPGWESQVSDSIEGAFDADLARVEPPGHRNAADPLDPGGLARVLLSALTWGLGAGLPEEEWLACANAGLPPGTGIGADDVMWVLDQLGRYVVQDGEAGEAVYRIAHQSLADHLRPAYQARHDQVFDPQALPVAVSLAARYRALIGGGIAAVVPAYLWRYMWRHAADSGPAGLPILRQLAAADRDLLPDVAMAALQVAGRLRYWGRRQDAVPPAEETVQLYREQARDNPAYLPDLAGALGNLGTSYGEVGRRQDALAPAEEAVQLRREQARDNPAYLPDLAMALGNLGNRYSQVGRRQDALAPAEEAVQLRREQARDNPAYLPDLAMALGNLGNRYSQVGRRQDALAPAEEAVQLYREQARDNPAYLPDLARTLGNLGTFYNEVGRRQDALAPAEEAVQLRREQARDNPAYLPDLAGALGNLGTFYNEVGRRQDALAPAEEAVQLRREQARDNPAYLPDLAGALGNLGTFYSEVGRRRDALAPAEEAVQLYREQARDNPAYLPNLAMALGNLGTFYSEVGRRQDALAPAEEAVQLRREQARDNPAYLPNLAMALGNLGTFYSQVGRRQDALAPAEEAVQLYREQARDNPAYLPNLAGALGNLGTFYSEVGRRQDALAPAEEAAQLYREQARDNPAYLPDLAGVLGNLGNRYSEVGRRQDALAPAEEAVQLRREQARDNPAYLPNLAGVLGNLGNRYSEVGRRQDALAPTEEAVQLYREQARDNPAYLPDLAGALGNLGTFYGEVGRRQDALAPAEEAVQLYREQARDNPAYLPDFARTLGNLSTSYSEVGTPESGERAWREALAEAPPADAAFLVASRAEAAEAGHPDAARWLAAGLRDASDDRELAAVIHEQARRHRAAAQAAFDAAWERHAGQPVPGWLTVDTDLVAIAEAWVGTETYEEEGAYLGSHPELLDTSADEAVSEALLSVGEEEDQRYTALRQNAQAGAEAAYRPLLLRILASEFAVADPGGQRALLATRRDDLLDEAVTETLDDLAGQDDTAAAAERARALLDLARSGDAEPVLDALAEPARFPGLLQALAARDDLAALPAAAVVAYTAAATDASAATAIFYLATGTAISGDQDQARDLITQARDLDPDQATGWVNQLASIGQHHPAVLPLIAALTAPPGQPGNASSRETDDDTD